MTARRPAIPSRQRAPARSAPRHGLARVLSKLGHCSRSQGEALVRAGRVSVNGRVSLDPEFPVDAANDRISVDHADVGQVEKVYIAMNKPRGYVTTASDERGRDTVYTLLQNADRAMSSSWLAPVGRLDRASEGLLLFSNDTAWAARLADPSAHVDKTYHVQVDTLIEAELIGKLAAGAEVDGEMLSAKAVRELRRGEKNSWLEIVLDEGRNRQIRRLLAAFDIGVLRLIRVAIGSLALGELGKGQARRLTPDEVVALAATPGTPA